MEIKVVLLGASFGSEKEKKKDPALQMGGGWGAVGNDLVFKGH